MWRTPGECWEGLSFEAPLVPSSKATFFLHRVMGFAEETERGEQAALKKGEYQIQLWWIRAGESSRQSPGLGHGSVQF